MNIDRLYPWFRLDALSGFAAISIFFFFVLILLYSVRFMRGKPGLIQYYAYVILTAVVSIAAVLANDLLILLICWGFLGLTLYLLVNMGDNAAATAKKTFIIIGSSDALMLLGIGIIYRLTGILQMDNIRISLADPVSGSLAVFSYICLAVACFAKAGAIPFHSWVPDCAQDAPLPVVAYLPASLDKLLGIYLLARVSLELFVLNQAMNILLMLVGAFTVIGAAMIALVQDDIRKTLGYLTVASAGYMILGIGTDNPVGIAGGLFYMLNSAICNSCLFLCAGNIIYRTATSKLDKLGGLAGFMPLTYVSALVASLAISGIPPFNGFFSKWMIYQGIVGSLPESRSAGAFCLVMAMFGSALILASFMKLLHAVFLGQSTPQIANSKPREAGLGMTAPVLVLSLLCVVFGAFGYKLPLEYFIYPAIGITGAAAGYAPSVSAALVILAVMAGLGIYYLSMAGKYSRRDDYFVGGEPQPIRVENKVSGTEFYNTVREFGVLKAVYSGAEKGYLDIYEQGKSLVFGIGRFLQFLHNGVLPTYMIWTLIGMTIMFFVLMR